MSEDLRSHAATLFAHGQFEDAKRIYLQLLAATESTGTNEVAAQLHANLSACCVKLDRTSDAIQHALVCVQLRPSWNKAHFRLLSALLAANAWPRAYRAALAAQCALSASDYASIQDVVSRAYAQHVLRWYAPLCSGGKVHVEWLSAERGKGVVVSRSVSGALPVGTVLFSEKPLAAHRGCSSKPNGRSIRARTA
jgi:tetratricopeptide (TPR) repeat protein